MRKALEKIEGERMRFRARVSKLETRSIFYGRYTVVQRLFMNVLRVDTGEVVCDHVWFADGLCWSGVQMGDIVEFDARVCDYVKGYKEKVLDWKLNRPTRIEVIKKEESHSAARATAPAAGGDVNGLGGNFELK